MQTSVESGYYSVGGFVVRVINGVFGLVEAVLVVRLVLELLAADPAAPFIGWVYGITDPLVNPFVGAFPALTVGGGYGLELATLIAMVGYAIIGWLIIKLFSLIF